ncbi:MAG: hypothetical protein B6245_05065 [Desulfobacteraceae bacterium 4572_88]|nr:MAG: hypothetical protein B6245_05065 [Desulfobacteraceae bacterium 4572_88]
MKWEDIQKDYKDNWVLLEEVQVDEDLDVLGGNVIYFHPNKENVYKKLLELRPDRSAIEFAGDIPEDIALML